MIGGIAHQKDQYRVIWRPSKDDLKSLSPRTKEGSVHFDYSFVPNLLHTVKLDSFGVSSDEIMHNGLFHLLREGETVRAREQVQGPWKILSQKAHVEVLKSRSQSAIPSQWSVLKLVCTISGMPRAGSLPCASTDPEGRQEFPPSRWSRSAGDTVR